MEEFEQLTIESKSILDKYFNLREVKNCECHFNTLFIWRDYFDVQYIVKDDFAIITQKNNGDFYSIMPICKEEHFKKAFEFIRGYFHKKNIPFKMSGIDKKFLNFIENEYKGEFNISSNRDYYDYIYDAEKLRTLKGKKYNKKRNHLNAFYKVYGDKFEYRKLNINNKEEICSFLKFWQKEKDNTETLDVELKAICNVMSFADKLDVKIGGIYINNKLEAFSIGSKVNGGKEAIIHIEKANYEIRGLYQLINQQFLLNEFPDVTIVNREEDLGVEGLRKSKLSYYPIELLEKYEIVEK